MESTKAHTEINELLLSDVANTAEAEEMFLDAAVRISLNTKLPFPIRLPDGTHEAYAVYYLLLGIYLYNIAVILHAACGRPRRPSAKLKTFLAAGIFPMACGQTVWMMLHHLHGVMTVPFGTMRMRAEQA